MNGYIAFVKKEFTENMKNHRFFIMLAVFLAFGMMSAFLAKFTPKILSALAAEMEMTSEPIALDAWKQFYKNISGVGFSAVIILYGSCLSGEYSKRTLVLMVTKGLSRKDVIFAKYTVAAVLMTISFWGSYAFTYGCTALLSPHTKLSNVVLAACSLWIVGFLYLSILMVGCVLFKQTFTSILFTVMWQIVRIFYFSFAVYSPSDVVWQTNAATLREPAYCKKKSQQVRLISLPLAFLCYVP